MTNTQKEVARAIRGCHVPTWDKREVATALMPVLNVSKNDADEFVKSASDPNHKPA